MAFTAQLYEQEGKAKAGEWFTAPKGIQVINREIYPSWYNRAKAETGVKLTFDKVSKKKATDCTPAGAKVELTVTKTTDPTTKSTVYLAPDGYDASRDDDFHKCGDVAPDVAGICINGNNISIRVSKGTNNLQTLDVSVNGASVASINVTDSGTYSTNYNFPGGASTVVATVTDTGYYADSASQAYSGSGNCTTGASQRGQKQNAGNQNGGRRGRG